MKSPAVPPSGVKYAPLEIALGLAVMAAPEGSDVQLSASRALREALPDETLRIGLLARLPNSGRVTPAACSRAFRELTRGDSTARFLADIKSFQEGDASAPVSKPGVRP